MNGIISFEAAGWIGPVVLCFLAPRLTGTACCRSACIPSSKEQYWKGLLTSG